AAVHFNQQFDIRPHSSTDRFHKANTVQTLLSFHLVVPGSERIELEGAVALGHRSPCGPAKVFRRTGNLIPGVGVGFNSLTHRPAEQNINRKVSRLAEDIPASGLDQTDG